MTGCVLAAAAANNDKVCRPMLALINLLSAIQNRLRAMPAGPRLEGARRLCKKLSRPLQRPARCHTGHLGVDDVGLRMRASPDATMHIPDLSTASTDCSHNVVQGAILS